ncbi:MATE family efflux transporter [Demequina sp. NBRC 110057]|uniref:MATE family efflux transporter n=1 Tax=Demequina sp. NBRC 110057 TaxID=1570346 RepID=UPI00190E9EBB|nr:MATE family efflux transporter [Demequina sp. NBRC 110057]
MSTPVRPDRTGGPDRAEDLATRPLGSLLWWSCSQTTLGVGVYGIYALTNAWFVSRGVGETALAAVNLVAPLLLLLGAVSTTVGVGAASLVARRLGGGDPASAGRAAGNAFSLFWATALATTGIGLAFLDPLLRLVGATDATLPYARPYAAVLLAGAVFSTGFSAIVRAEGQVGYSTAIWVAAVAVQITLDPLLIYGLDMGVTGAALGTVGGQAVSAAMALWFFFGRRRRPYRVGARDLIPQAATVRDTVAIGSPSLLAGIGSTLLVALANAALATAGVAALAAYALAERVRTFVTMPQIGITQGVQPIVAYNHGRGHHARVARTLTLSLRATVLYGIGAAGLIAVAASPVASLFVSDAAAHGEAVTALRIVMIGVAVAGLPPLIAASFQSRGMPGPSYVISLGTLLVIKVPLVLVLGGLGPTGVWVALAAGEVLAAAAALAVLARARRRIGQDRLR